MAAVFITNLPASNALAGTEVLPADQNQSGQLMTVKVTPLQITDLKTLYTDTGTANTLVITPTIAYTAYTAGQFFTIKIGNTNTGATTLNVNGIAAKSVITPDGGALQQNMLVAGGSYLFLYNGTSFVLLDATQSSSVTRYWVDSGAANTYVITPSPAWTSYVAGSYVYVNVTHNNTGAATLNVSGLGARNVLMADGSALQQSALVASGIYLLIYNGTAFQVIGASTGNTVGSYWVDSGAANAYVITPSPAWTSYVTGMRLFVKMANANTGASTINVNGLGTKTIVTPPNSALTRGEIQANAIYELIYDGTNFQIPDPTVVTTNNSFYVGGGSANAITVTPFIPYTAYASGMRIQMLMGFTTTGTATLNVNGLGATNLFYSDGVTQLKAGSLISGVIYDFIYDSTISGFICVNPSRVTGTFTITLTGITGTPSGTINYSIGQDGMTVFIWILTNINGVSTTTAMTGTGVPALLAPANSKFFNMRVEDSGSGISGLVQSGTSTTWTFLVNYGISSATGFTATGTKGVLQFQTGYSLD